jgi:hypothetical protein
MDSTEVRFYCANGNRVFYLGSTHVHLSDTKAPTLTIPGPLNTRLKGLLYMHLEYVRFMEKPGSSIRIYPLLDSDGKLFLCYYLSDGYIISTTEKHRLLRSRAVDVHVWNVPTVTFLLQADVLCSILVNAFLRVCSVVEYGTSLRGTHCIRFFMREKKRGLPLLLQAYVARMDSTSTRYIVVELNYFYHGYYCYIRRGAWIAKLVTSEDIIVGRCHTTSR